MNHYQNKSRQELISEIYDLQHQLLYQQNSEENETVGNSEISEMDFTFADLVNIDDLQKMMDLLFELTGFPIGIIDIQNNILVATGWQDICTKFHRKHQETNQKSIESDAYIARHLKKGTYVEYKCKNGLWDLAQPILIEGRHVATVFLGQFLYDDEELDLEFFEKQAEKYGFDKKEYLEALKRLPRFSHETVKKLMQLYVHIAHILSEQGIATLKHIREIENRKLAEFEARERERRLSTLMSNLPGMAYRCRNDRDWTMEFVSDGCYDLTGYAPEDLLYNKKIAYNDLIHPDEQQRVNDQIQEALQQDKHFLLEYRMITKNGEEKWVWEKGCGIHLLKNEYVRLEGLIIDITDLKESERHLAESELKYRKLIEDSNDAIYLIRDGKFTLINEKFTEMFGVTLSDVQQPDFDIMQLVAPECHDYIQKRLEMVESGDLPVTPYEFTAISKTGDRLEVEASVSYIQYKEGVAVQGILRDISARRKMEQQLFQSKKMESIGTLAGGIAHDFNNLITVINGHAELAMLELGEQHPSRKDIASILNAGKKAENLIRQLLTFSRKQRYKPIVVDANKIIQQTENMWRRLIEDDIHIEYKLEPEAPRIKADPNQLEQVLMNLVINARDAVNELPNRRLPKKISIETSTIEIDAAYAKQHLDCTPGHYLLISVKDNGIGMDENQKSKIFEPFFSTKESSKGTGLGLSTVFGIVKQNGGFINVSTESRQGSTIRIFWPLTDEPEKTEEIKTAEEVSGAGHENILIVEDDPEVRDFAASALKKLGYQVYVAANGKDALELVREVKVVIDLMVTDLVMPEMNGKELAVLMTKIFPAIKVIFTSGYTDNSINQNGMLEVGVNFLKKPYSLKALSECIQKLLEKTEI